MKVAVSVPDRVFEAAERTARRLKVSRSRLYSRAVQAYVGVHGGRDITERLNAIYGTDKARSRMDPVMESMALEVLRREPW